MELATHGSGSPSTDRLDSLPRAGTFVPTTPTIRLCQALVSNTGDQYGSLCFPSRRSKPSRMVCADLAGLLGRVVHCVYRLSRARTHLRGPDFRVYRTNSWLGLVVLDVHPIRRESDSVRRCGMDRVRRLLDRRFAYGGRSLSPLAPFTLCGYRYPTKYRIGIGGRRRWYPSKSSLDETSRSGITSSTTLGDFDRKLRTEDALSGSVLTYFLGSLVEQPGVLEVAISSITGRRGFTKHASHRKTPSLKDLLNRRPSGSSAQSRPAWYGTHKAHS